MAFDYVVLFLATTYIVWIYCKGYSLSNAMLTIGLCISLREKCPNMGLFLIRIYLHLDFSANTGKYGPEITLYLDTYTQCMVIHWSKGIDIEFIIQCRFPKFKLVADDGICWHYGNHTLRIIRRYEKLDYRIRKLELELELEFSFLETCLNNCLCPTFAWESSNKDESILHLKSKIKDVGLSSYRIYMKKIIVMKTYMISNP